MLMEAWLDLELCAAAPVCCGGAGGNACARGGVKHGGAHRAARAVECAGLEGMGWLSLCIEDFRCDADLIPQRSSIGRASDCRVCTRISEGHWFDSGR